MEFRLVYDGPLPAASHSNTRNKVKHSIRRQFADQLEELWNTHPRLRYDSQSWDKDKDRPNPFVLEVTAKHGVRYTHLPPQTFDRCERCFEPLVTSDHGVGCALDILFLRRDQPGSLISHGGDIDNRIKVLFDALKLPELNARLPGDPKDDPERFYCLLEDDRLISDVRVTTDRLLTPMGDDERKHDVRLVVHVRTVVLDPGKLDALSF